MRFINFAKNSEKIEIFEPFDDKVAIGLSSGRLLTAAAADAARTGCDAKVSGARFVAAGVNCDGSLLVAVLRGNELLALDLCSGRFLEYFYKYVFSFLLTFSLFCGFYLFLESLNVFRLLIYAF